MKKNEIIASFSLLVFLIALTAWLQRGYCKCDNSVFSTGGRDTRTIIFESQNACLFFLENYTRATGACYTNQILDVIVKKW